METVNVTREWRGGRGTTLRSSSRSSASASPSEINMFLKQAVETRIPSRSPPAHPRARQREHGKVDTRARRRPPQRLRLGQPPSHGCILLIGQKYSKYAILSASQKSTTYQGGDKTGLITSAEAAKLGMSRRRWSSEKLGKLVRVARGVYRMPIWPSQPQAPYAIAVKATAKGPSSAESRLWRCWGWCQPTLLMRLATPRRCRRNLGPGVTLKRMGGTVPVYLEGIACQPLPAAIAAASKTMGVEQGHRGRKRGARARLHNQRGGRADRGGDDPDEEAQQHAPSRRRDTQALRGRAPGAS